MTILAYFGGLRLHECMELKLAQIIRHADGYTITHSRAKQRIDKKFVVPLEGGYADRLSIYLTKINKQLDKYQGRVWYTSTQHFLLKNQVLGKNTWSNLPHEIAKFLSAPECDKYTFHLFRRTATTSAADAGSSTEQLMDFFGWKNRSMCQVYISSSKPAILGMASRLGRFEALSQDSWWRWRWRWRRPWRWPSSPCSRRWMSTLFWRRIPRCTLWLACSLCLCLTL